MVFIICGYVRDVPIIHFNLDFTKNALSLSVNVFNTEVLIEDTIFTPPAGDGAAILRRGHPSQVKVYLLAV